MEVVVFRIPSIACTPARTAQLAAEGSISLGDVERRADRPEAVKS